MKRRTKLKSFRYRPFDEAKRLGLSIESKSKLRELFTEEIGVLVVEIVVPEGPAYTLLEKGDLLLSINDEHRTKFVPFENAIDFNVSKEVVIIIECGGKILEFEIRVGNLHEM